MATGPGETKPLTRPAQENIETVARLEEECADRRTFSERIGDAIADFTGSMRFIWAHLILFVVWFCINLRLVPGVAAFDPYPFVLLTLIVSAEAVIISTFVLMKQNRMSRRADQRDHLNLQIDLLAEKEITKMLQMQRLVCARLGIEGIMEDQDVKELSQSTAVDSLAHNVQSKIPE